MLVSVIHRITEPDGFFAPPLRNVSKAPVRSRRGFFLFRAPPARP